MQAPKDTLKCSDIHRDFEDPLNADGTQKVVGIKFFKSGEKTFGEIEVVERGIKCGSNINGFSAIQPVSTSHDGKLTPVGNPKSFRWYLIMEYKNHHTGMHVKATL